MYKWGLGIGDWGLGIGDWGLGPIPNPQIPNPQSPIPIPMNEILDNVIIYFYLFFSFFSIKDKNVF
jgi:hypothetical protein